MAVTAAETTPSRAIRAELGASGVCLRRVAWPRAGERDWVVVEPQLVGLCSSDLKEVRRVRELRSDFGHELVGVVHSGSVPGLDPGLRVCLDPHVEVERWTAFGTAMLLSGAAEELRAALPAAPAGAPDERAVFVEPLACVAHCAERVRPGSRVAVIGAGSAGVLLSVLLRLRGCEVVLVNRGAPRLRTLAAKRLVSGTPLVLAASAQADGFDSVVVTTTSLDDASFQLAWRLLPPADGQLVLFGGIASDWRAPESGAALDAIRRAEGALDLSYDGKRARVVGAHGPTGADFATAVRVLDAPLPWTRAHVDELIETRTDLRGLVKLLTCALKTGSDPIGKCVVEIGGARQPCAPALSQSRA